jgi:4a-hydroxytetrahydrobiopterin dehydratase
MENIYRKPLPGWTQEGQSLIRTDVFADFAAAMRWVNQVAILAERRNHHPDIDIRWNRVTLKLTTHETGGLTDRDWDWAEAAVLELGQD